MAVNVHPTLDFIASLPKLMSLTFPFLCRQCQRYSDLDSSKKYTLPTPQYFTPKLLNALALPFMPKPTTTQTPQPTAIRPIPAPRKLKTVQPCIDTMTSSMTPSTPVTPTTFDTPTAVMTPTTAPVTTEDPVTVEDSLPAVMMSQAKASEPAVICKAVVVRYCAGTPVVKAPGIGWGCHLCSMTFDSEDDLLEHRMTPQHNEQAELQRKYLHECGVCKMTCSGLDSFSAHITGRKHRRNENNMSGVKQGNAAILSIWTSAE